jgi:hypothetical protein
MKIILKAGIVFDKDNELKLIKKINANMYFGVVSMIDETN